MKNGFFLILVIGFFCGCAGIGEQYLVKDSSESVGSDTRSVVGDTNNNSINSEPEEPLTNDSSSNNTSVVGHWKVTSAGGGFPSPNGSVTIFNNNGTFSADNNIYNGSYTHIGSTLTMRFSDGSNLIFNVTFNGENMRIQGTNNTVWVEYKKT
jgi:hypothetical protein